MNILDKLGSGLAQSIDIIIDKNRQYAQLNRLSAVIRSETEILNRAYIALGKHYHKILEGNTEDADMSHICAVIESSKIRLKKAQARYDYIEKYGLTKKEVKQPVTKISADEYVQPEIDVCSDDEDEDITIAYADSLALPKAADTETTVETANISEIEADKNNKPEETSAESDIQITAKAETATELKNKRSAVYAKKKSIDISDAEVANENDVNPIA